MTRLLSIAASVVIHWVDDESVSVDGAVRSLADRVAALRTAWELPGVRRVHDAPAIWLAPGRGV